MCYAYLWQCILLFCLAGPNVAQETQLKAHLEHFQEARNPLLGNDIPRVEARRYIKEKFRELGLVVTSQSFNTILKPQYEEQEVTGENIIGVAEGTTNGSVIVVGADYDTPLQGSPLEDNGAGVAALLEVARHFKHQTSVGGPFKQLNTVVFVAFDLNVKSYGNNHPGKPGSYHFLHQWLWPYIGQSPDNFTGAIILDSISRYSTESNTQYLPQEFKDFFPAAATSIFNSNSKANFVAMFTRDDLRSTALANTVASVFEKDRKARMFRLQPLPVRDGLSFTGVLDMFNHQSHFPFWSFRPSEESVPLPAVLLTDTDIYRTTIDSCPSQCSADVFLTRGREVFITKITQSVTSTLLDIQTDRLGETSSGLGGASAPTFLIAIVIAISRIIL